MESCSKISSSADPTRKAFFDHSSAQRVNTSSVVVQSLHEQYPHLELVIVSVQNCNLLEYATSTGEATFALLNESSKAVPSSLQLTQYFPPLRRTEDGKIGDNLLLGKFLYSWKSDEYIVYLVNGRDGQGSYPQDNFFYILTADRPKAEALAHAAGKWGNELHEEVWVFDSGYWQKSAELFNSIRNASWNDVILASAMKKAIIDDHLSFFSSKEKFAKLKVPWKRGVIYYGPPGNGKTISIKAMMHSLHNLEDPIPTLYVRSLTSVGGGEYSIRQIFTLARKMAPCYLVFEDLDSLITNQLRSYFLNEVDGLKSNDGIFMVGSTNHLDQLDPGIAKRPSRFDRKYLFSDPNKEERVAYCHFWQSKLIDNKEIEFPDVLCVAIANITDKFSFAYIQEAFVAALLAIERDTRNEAMHSGGTTREHVDGDWVDLVPCGDQGLEKYILWTQIKMEIHTLRKSMDEEHHA